MDKLLAKLSEQQAVLTQQNEALKSSDEEALYPRALDHASSSNSLPITPATDAFPSTAPTTRPASATLDEGRVDHDEVLRLKLQLAHAQNEISKLDRELAHTRSTKDESEAPNFGFRGPAQLSRESTWGPLDDARSDTSDNMSSTTFNRTRGIWGNPKASSFGNTLQAPVVEPTPGSWLGGRGFNQPYGESNAVPYPVFDYRGDRLTPDPDMIRPAHNRRGNRYEGRYNSPQPMNNGYNGGYNNHGAQPEFMGAQMPVGNSNVSQGMTPMGMGAFSPYQPQPAGTPLSPHASEFTSKAAWKTEVSIKSRFPFFVTDNIIA